MGIPLMKRLASFVLAAVAIMSTDATRSQATEVGTSRNFGLGFQIGEPTAVTAKLFVGGAHAFDFGLGFGGWGYDWCRDGNGNSYRCGNINHNFSLHMDYLYEENIINRNNKSALRHPAFSLGNAYSKAFYCDGLYALNRCGKLRK